MPDHADDQDEREDLEQIVSHLLAEARMVLPGVQTLFGFQLIAVFTEVFLTRLTAAERGIHALAISLCLLCVVAILTPAAYHRQVEPRSISERFVRVCSWAVTGAMALLLAALACDFYLVARVITGSVAVAAGLAGGFILLASTLWFIGPVCMHRRLRRQAGR